jgi:hypothetical protein
LNAITHGYRIDNRILHTIEMNERWSDLIAVVDTRQWRLIESSNEALEGFAGVGIPQNDTPLGLYDPEVLPPLGQVMNNFDLVSMA